MWLWSILIGGLIASFVALVLEEWCFNDSLGDGDTSLRDEDDEKSYNDRQYPHIISGHVIYANLHKEAVRKTLKRRGWI